VLYRNEARFKILRPVIAKTTRRYKTQKLRKAHNENSLKKGLKKFTESAEIATQVLVSSCVYNEATKNWRKFGEEVAVAAAAKARFRNRASAQARAFVLRGRQSFITDHHRSDAVLGLPSFEPTFPDDRVLQVTVVVRRTAE
jgi:hypothetical protein